jgi:hypothetical protein
VPRLYYAIELKFTVLEEKLRGNQRENGEDERVFLRELCQESHRRGSDGI